MKKIDAVVKPFKFDEIIEALKNENIQRFTVSKSKGPAVGRAASRLDWLRLSSGSSPCAGGGYERIRKVNPRRS